MDCPDCKSKNAEAAETCFGCGRALGPQGLQRGAVLAGRYELLETLGSGGMGVVYKAHDRTLDETVALKVLRPEVAGHEEIARRFQSEIKLARKIRHKNVCAIHEYGEDGALRFITMEYIDGIDLRQVMTRDGALPPTRAYDLAAQLADGLKAIHDAGIVHRDLKTPNVMLDSQGVAHLMDFGIAKRLDQQGTTGADTVTGTPEYMSPEQARGEAVDFRTDIYALGVVIFELFAGRVPFRGDTPIATIFKHLQEPPPLSGVGAPRLPPALVPVLAKALAKDPGQRHRTVEELIVALQQARAGVLPQGADVPAAGPALWTCPRCRRHVPARVGICRCGQSRHGASSAMTPVPVAPQAQPGRRGLLIAAGGALLLAGLAVGLAMFQRPAPSVPPPAVAMPASPTATLASVAVTPATPADPPPSSLPPSTSSTPGPAPAMAPVPAALTPPPTPTSTPTPAATPAETPSSDVDVKREAGLRAFEQTVAQLAQRAEQWRAVDRGCLGSGTPIETSSGRPAVDCSRPRQQLGALATEIVDGMTRAEDEARRAWVPPGALRTIRQQHGLDQDAVDKIRTESQALLR